MIKATAFGLAIVAVVLTLASGMIQGRITQRWGPANNTRDVAERFAGFPETVGDWVMTNESELTENVQRQLQYNADIYRRYTNQATGEVIDMVVLIGPSGPLSVHDPEICYSSRDYQPAREREAVEVAEKGQPDSELWELMLESKNVDGMRMWVMFGWTTDGRWVASSRPRIDFLGQPHLIKIQVVSLLDPAVGEESDEESNPCRRFLEDFIPQFREYVIEPATS